MDNAPVRAAVDLHCHPLPGLDDGARDLDDAVAMAQQAEADGIAAICATPHIRHDHDVRIEELPERIAELSAAIARAGCRTRVLPGGEVAVPALGGLDDDDLRRVSLGGAGRWILLEPPAGPLGDAVDRAVHELHARGFRALIAHPERHLTGDLVERLRELTRQGALVQVTAAYLTGEESRAGMLALARAGVVHVLGSDAHTSRAGRRVELGPALAALGAEEPTAAGLEWIARTAPQAIVRGDAVVPPF